MLLFRRRVVPAESAFSPVRPRKAAPFPSSAGSGCQRFLFRSDTRSCVGRAGCEQFAFAAVIGKLDHFFEAQAEFFKEGDGGLIVRLGDGHDSFEPQRGPAVVQDGRGGFAGVAVRPIFFQEREADVHMLERIAFEQAADSSGHGGIFQRDEVQAEAESAVAGDGAFGDVATGVSEAARAPIADIFKESRLVQKLEDERSVLRGEAANEEPISFKNFHSANVAIFSRHARISSWVSAAARIRALPAPDALPALALRDAPAAERWLSGSTAGGRRSRLPWPWWAACISRPGAAGPFRFRAAWRCCSADRTNSR